MDLFFDRAQNELTRTATGGGTLKAMEEKRGDTIPLRLYVRTGDVAGTLEAGFEMRFGIKVTVAGGLLALAATWTPGGTEGSEYYEAVLDLNTAELQTAIADKNVLACLAELTISEDGGDTWVSSQTISFTVRNDVNKETDGSPTTLPGPVDWLAARSIVYDPDIIAQTGGGASKLDGIATVDVEVGRIQLVRAGAVLMPMELVAGTTVENAPLVVRPDDYHVTTNPKVWVLRGAVLNGLDVQELLTRRLVIENAELGTAEVKADLVEGDLEFQLPPRAGTLVPFIDITANLTDNAGIALVGDVFKLVLRHQSLNTWHEFTIVDSTATPGTPTYQISAAL